MRKERLKTKNSDESKIQPIMRLEHLLALGGQEPLGFETVIT